MNFCVKISDLDLSESYILIVILSISNHQLKIILW